MVCIIFGITRVVIRAVEVCLWIIYYDSWVIFIMQLILRSAAIHWRFMQSLLNWLVCWTGMWSALILRVSWWASVWRQSAMWGVTVGMISIGMRASWNTPVVMSNSSIVWPRASSVWIAATVTVISVGRGLRPWSAVSVSVLVTVARSQSGVVPGMGFQSVMMCRCTRGWYLMQTVHYYMSVFITFEVTYIWAMSCCMAWSLTLKTLILFMWH